MFRRASFKSAALQSLRHLLRPLTPVVRCSLYLTAEVFHERCSLRNALSRSKNSGCSLSPDGDSCPPHYSPDEGPPSCEQPLPSTTTSIFPTHTSVKLAVALGTTVPYSKVSDSNPDPESSYTTPRICKVFRACRQINTLQAATFAAIRSTLVYQHCYSNFSIL
jgi:hypothetical protein